MHIKHTLSLPKKFHVRGFTTYHWN